MKSIIEACVETLEEAVNAYRNGANRIELCEELYLGGTTPNLNLVKEVLKEVKIPIRVMVRPRGGDFVYSPQEFDQMKRNIELFKELPLEGVVFGLLTEEHKVDFKRTKELIELAKPMKVTFHKAIDEVKDIVEASIKLVDYGVDNILSSGGAETAILGAEVLKDMVEGTKDKIIVAGRVTYENLDEIKRLVPSSNYHGRRIVDSTKKSNNYI